MKAINAIIGLSMGAMIWALSPMLTGHKEPWDGSMTIYLSALFIAGMICAFPRPCQWWTGVIGIYFGQWTYIFLVIGGGTLWPIGMVMGAVLMLASVVGGLSVWGIWTITTRSKRAKIK